MPARMTIEMIYYSVFWLNSFPPTVGIYDILLIGSKLDYRYTKHCQLEFVTYAHEEHDNSMATRTTGAIALRPTGNAQVHTIL